MEAIKELIKDYIISDELSPGISLAVIKEDKCLYKESYGYSNLENKIKINSNTNFYLASVSKTFTGAAIMLLQERGYINVNDNIIKYFTDLPIAYKDIKIMNLVNHTSGVKDYFSYFLEEKKLNDVTNEDVYNFVLEENTLDFPVGTEFKYSNTGYVLLSILVEKVSGVNF